MTLKQRIENMKLPGHNGPALREVNVKNRRMVALLARRITQREKAKND